MFRGGGDGTPGGAPSAPVSQELNRTAMHLAARAGNLDVLLLLLQSKPHCLARANADDLPHFFGAGI